MSKFGKFLGKCKICIVGAGGSIGRHLALNLKLNKYVTDLSLFDKKNMAGIKEDLSHIDTQTRVTAFSGDEKALIDSLECSNLVVIVAGQAHSPKHKTREALLDANAELMIKFMEAIVSVFHNDMPFIHIVTNPIKSIVPLCAEYLKENGCFNSRKLIGSSSVDSMRARTFLGELVSYDPSKIIVPVVGGHSTGSITPLVSQSKPRFELSAKEQKKLEDRIIHGAAEVIKAMEFKGSAYLSMAHCVGKFCNSVCRAIYGEENVTEVGYVAADINELEYFACNFSMNSEGIKEFHRLPPMTPYELELYYKAIKDVQDNIDTAREIFKEYKLRKS